MDALVNNKQTYEVLKRDPTPALQRKLNNKLLKRKKTDRIDFRRYNRLRCSVPQPPKLYGLPKLHKSNIPMRPIVSSCGYPTYQLSKYLTTVLKSLTDKLGHKLQHTENFIDVKQLHGTAMGSKDSVVVTELVMQNIEEQTRATYTRTKPLWLRYVDDTFTTGTLDEIDNFQTQRGYTVYQGDRGEW